MTPKRKVNIALDGPSGAGKSTLSKAVAKEFGLIYVDTGAIYRAVGLYALKNHIEPDNQQAVISMLPDIHINLSFDGEQHILLNGEDVSEEIRIDAVSQAASKVSAIPEVREFLLLLQRSIASEQSVIMDGRDIGTVILPEADLKLFLTATPEERAKRRFEQLSEKGQHIPYEKVLSDMIERDNRDTKRDHCPLVPASDAVLLDTTGDSFSDSFTMIKEVIKGRLKDVF